MKVIRKSTFREIKSSLGRFLAIFAIIALGVGFFAGLKVARGSMLDTVKDYLDEHAFYDFRLLSALGFDPGDTERLRQQEDVAAVEGAVSLDVLYQLEDGSQGVVKVHSLTDTVNTVELVSGRFPETDNECVADSAMFGEGALGSVISLSEDNEVPMFFPLAKGNSPPSKNFSASKITESSIFSPFSLMSLMPLSQYGL